MVWENDGGGKSHHPVSGRVLECDNMGNSNDETAGSN